MCLCNKKGTKTNLSVELGLSLSLSVHSGSVVGKRLLLGRGRELSGLSGQGLSVVGLVPLSERSGIDLNDGTLDESVGSDQLVVGRVVRLKMNTVSACWNGGTGRAKKSRNVQLPQFGSSWCSAQIPRRSFQTQVGELGTSLEYIKTEMS